MLLGIGRVTGRGRKGTGVVVFGLSEGCVGCFRAGRGSIRCRPPLFFLWNGRVASVSSFLGLFSVGFGIALVGPMAPIIPVEEDTILAEMTVDDFAMAEVGVECVAEGIRMTSQVGRKRRLNFLHQYRPGNL